MVKPHGRQIRKQVGRILLLENKKEALKQLENIPGPMLTGPLFRYFYSLEDLLRFRSSAAMGHHANRLAEKKTEDARIILRRLMWNLNDESGGIGWGSVEAMAEVLKNNKSLAQEFQSILFSYIDPDGNFIEHEMLQRGLLWGIGTFLETVKIVDEKLKNNILPFLESEDAVKRGYALRAFINMDSIDIDLIPSDIFKDKTKIPVFDGWNLFNLPVCELMQEK